MHTFLLELNTSSAWCINSACYNCSEFMLLAMNNVAACYDSRQHIHVQEAVWHDVSLGMRL